MKATPKNLAGQKIRQILKKHGVTQTSLAKEINMMPCQLIDYMQKRRTPSIKIAMRIKYHIKERFDGYIVDVEDWLMPVEKEIKDGITD